MDQRLVSDERECMRDHAFNFIADVPTVFHCHHFNLFWDQTVDDGLGQELGTMIRTHAARESFHDLLSALAERTGAHNATERLELARVVAQGLGMGTVRFDLDRYGGQALGDHLHYAVAWLEKYPSVRRRHPSDALTAGFVAAASEVAFQLPRDSMRCREQECLTLGDARCRFRAEPGEPAPATAPMRRSEVERAAGPLVHSQLERDIQPIVDTLRDFTAGIRGDERGLIEAFGLFVSQLPTTYYNRIGYDALRHLRRTAPQSVPVMQALMREAGHVCVFNTFGAIMASPEWEGLVGAPTGDTENTLAACMAIARALGMGRWCVTEYVHGERLVLRSPATYESTYYPSREGRAEESQCFMFQGAAVATMQLVARVQWQARPNFDQALYDELFQGGMPWSCEETQCVSKGDPTCEVVVSPRERPSTFIA